MVNEVSNELHQGYISIQLIAKYRSLFVFVFLLFLIVVDLEVAELIRVLCGSNYAQPISQVVLLQVLLGKILQITLAKRHSRGKDNLVPFIEVGFEVSAVHDTIFNGVTAVNGELEGGLLSFAVANGGISLAFQGLLSWLLLACLVGGSLLCSNFGCHGLPLLSSLGFSRKNL